MDSKTKEWLQELIDNNPSIEAEQHYQHLVGSTLEQSMSLMNHTVMKKVEKVRREYDTKSDEQIIQHLKKNHNPVLTRDRLRRKLASGLSGVSNST